MIKKLPWLVVLAIFLVYPKSLAAAGASLEFKPGNVNLKVGDTQNLGVTLNPGGAKVIGADLVIKFDPLVLQIDQTQDGKAFDRQMGLIVDNKQGKLLLSFSNNFGIFTTKPTEIAKIRLKALRESPGTTLKFDYTSGKTQDTNVVVDHGRDILTSVGEVTIKITAPKNPKSAAQQILGEQAPKFVPEMTWVTPSVWTWLPYLVIGLALIGLGVYNKNG